VLKSNGFYLFLAVAYTIVVIYLTLGDPELVMPDNYIDYQDKLLHLTAYIVLAILWGFYCLRKRCKNGVVITFVSSIAIGVILECMQEIVNARREFDYLDMLANCIGVFIGTIIVVYYKNLKLK